MATIRKRGHKYQVQIRRKGFPPVSRSFLKLKDAQQWARQCETQADRQELAPDPKVLEYAGELEFPTFTSTICAMRRSAGHSRRALAAGRPVSV